MTALKTRRSAARDLKELSARISTAGSVNPEYVVDKRMIARDELVDILSQAGAMQELAQRKMADSELTAKLDLSDDVDMGTLYEMAQSLGITREYVDQVVDMKHPSIDEQLRILDRMGVNPEGSVLIDKYAEDLLYALKIAYPLDKFKADVVHNGHEEWKHERFWSVDIYRIHEKKLYSRLLGIFGIKHANGMTRAKERMCNIRLKPFLETQYELFVTANNPMFLTACEKPLSDLESRFHQALFKVYSKYTYRLD